MNTYTVVAGQRVIIEWLNSGTKNVKWRVYRQKDSDQRKQQVLNLDTEPGGDWKRYDLGRTTERTAFEFKCTSEHEGMRVVNEQCVEFRFGRLEIRLFHSV